MTKIIAIVGSSHVSWWEHAIATQQIPRPQENVIFIGRGATPIWGDFIRQGVANIEDEVDEVFMLLGDFRHGNRILNSPKFLNSGDTSGNFNNIEKALINDENDKILLNLIIKSLQEMRTRLGSKLRILFWSLTFREFQNIENGRYGGPEHYCHPVWNLGDLIEIFHDVAIDTRALTKLPIHDFFLDASGHPNIKGHALLYRLLANHNVLSAYESVVTDFKNNSPLLFPDDAERYRVLITGDSVAINALEKAVRTHYFQIPATWTVNHLKSLDLKSNYDRIIYFSDLHFQDENSQQIASKIIETKATIDNLILGHNVTVILWTQWAREIVSTRQEYHLKFLPKSPDAYSAELEKQFTAYDVVCLSEIPFAEANGMVEFGGSFSPSGKGYAVLFHLIISKQNLAIALTHYQQFLIPCLNQVKQDDYSSMQGYFDGVNASGQLSGWAKDINYSNNPVKIYCWSGQNLIGTTLAKGLPTDSKHMASIDDRHGFSLGPLPLSQLRNFDTGTSLRVSFDANGLFELTNSPIKLDIAMLTRLAVGALQPWLSEFHLPKQDMQKQPIGAGKSLFIANKISWEKDPAIYPNTDVILDNAVIEAVKRLPGFFKSVVRARVIGGVYRSDGFLEPSALGSSALGRFHLADRTLTTTVTQHIDSECLYGGMILDHYGHFIIEGLARAHAFRRFPALPIVYTLPDSRISKADQLPSYIKSIFELLNIPLERIILVQETTSCKKLIIPKIGMRWWDYLAAEHQHILAMQVKIALGEDYPKQKQGCIYLSRSKLSTRHDGNIICGEAQFENYLRSEGITIVHPETLPVKEQVRLICASQQIIGFVGSSFHTLLLCADVPEKIFYLHRKKGEVNQQYPLIDKTLRINTVYLDNIIKNNARISLVDFESISYRLMAEGLVNKIFDSKEYELESEFNLLSKWIAIKKKNKNLSLSDRYDLENIIQQSVNQIVVTEAQNFLAKIARA